MLADEKMEAVITPNRRGNTAKVKVSVHTVVPKPIIKYLELKIDDKLSFREHLNYES